MKVTYQLDIAAPISRVFNPVDEDKDLKRWMDGLEETIYPSGYDRTNPVGTKFKQRIREGGRIAEYDGEVTAYQKAKRLGIRIGNRQFTMQVGYRFSETATGTRLDYSAEMVAGTWLAHFLSKLFNWFTMRLLDRQMKKLKAAAEAYSHLAAA